MPHGSGNEKQISDWLVCFAKEHNLNYVQDKENNVIIYKDGEGEPVILQAHMDMVCVKTDSSTKDMSKEGLDLEQDEKYLWAKDTSLGADDGIGVAMILEVLADDTLKMHPIEAVFTVNEEAGMTGAKAIDEKALKGKMLINLDSEEEGKITAGCAGGARLDIEIPCIRETLSKDDVCYEVTIDGLLGGHSGTAIHLHRANANRLLSRLFYGLSLKMEVKICEFKGGIVENAIASKARAVVAISANAIEDFERLTGKHEYLFKKEYPNEENLKLSFTRMNENAESAVVVRQSKAISRMLSSIPDGLRKMCDDFKDIPQTSSNLGVAELTTKGIRAEVLVRSSVAEEKQEVIDMITAMVKHDGGSVTINSEYPEWPYKKDSKLKDVAMKTFENINGKTPEITVTHGGLEIGYFESKINGLESISIGPDIFDIHSYNEKLELASSERTYKWLLEILKTL